MYDTIRHHDKVGASGLRVVGVFCHFEIHQQALVKGWEFIDWKLDQAVVLFDNVNGDSGFGPEILQSQFLVRLKHLEVHGSICILRAGADVCLILDVRDDDFSDALNLPS